MKKVEKRNWPKLVLQWGALAAIVIFIVGAAVSGSKADPEAYCPFGGLQALGSFMASESLTCSMTFVQIMMGVVLAVGIILFSRLFCGYVCPLGTVSESMSRAGKKTNMRLVIEQGSMTDKFLRIFKYILLFIVFYMTVSSSELFCKNFDPYYAAATGFKGEITLWMTLLAVGILFVGNFFVSMFWCKYICPLGALSNIFKFTIMFILILVLIWVLGIAGVASGWVWALAAACVISYVFEITCMKSKVFPLFRIERNEENCNKCKCCVKKCPYSIPVHELKTVKHIDCTLCGDCISACKEDALAINKKKSLRWLPFVAVIVLFVLGLTLGNKWELPTIDEKWGEYEKVENMQKFEMDGLRSVKCFGSSKAFSSAMQKVPGVYGVKTFVKRFAVIISYDPAVISPDGIRAAIFTPTKMKFSTPAPTVDSLKVIHLGVDGLFDKMDMVYFGLILRKIDGIDGFEANYNCPVDVKLYVNPAAEFSQKLLRDSIEVKQIVLGDKTIPVKFVLKSFEDNAGKVSRLDFVELMFAENRALSGTFKESTAKYTDAAKSVYEFEYPELEKPVYKRNFPYFKSFLSTNDGIVNIDVTLRDVTPVVQITYVTSMWDDKAIWEKLLNAPVWTLKMKDGTIKEEEPKLTFTKEGRTL